MNPTQLALVAAQLLALLVLPVVMLGLINRVKSFWAGRRGPGLLQPYADMRRLLRKEPVYSNVTTEMFRLGPVVALATSLVAGMLTPLLGPLSPLAFPLDFIAFAYVVSSRFVARSMLRRSLKPTGRIVLQLTPQSTALPDLALEDGDRLSIPSRPTTVGVFGSVFSAGSYLHSTNRTVGDYLRLAGGPTRGADDGSVFVIRANGTVNSSLQESGFFSRGNQIGGLGTEPGDTLASYRADARVDGGITFGMNAVIVEGIDCTLRVGQPVSVHLTNGGEGSSSAPSSSGTPAPTPVVAADTDQDERDHIDVSELEDATDVSTSGVDKLVQAFPGAELIEQETP